ncbi:hypothetical protein BACI9J_370001 [Bacillus altitudinis]|nr:hypothetical protein BACI9J_370001 [Bacillus altitudinis]
MRFARGADRDDVRQLRAEPTGVRRRGVEPEQQRPGAGDDLGQAGQGGLVEPGAEGDDLGEGLERGEECGAASGADVGTRHGASGAGNTNGAIVTPCSVRSARIARAIATASGESPCTHTEWARTAISDPSTAIATPSVTMRSTLAATSSGSCSTDPGCFRDTSEPSGS